MLAPPNIKIYLRRQLVLQRFSGLRKRIKGFSTRQIAPFSKFMTFTN